MVHLAERTGLVELAQERARRFADRHPTHARRIYGRTPPAIVPLLPPAPLEKVETVNLSPETRAEIEAIIDARVESLLTARKARLLALGEGAVLVDRPSAMTVVEIVARHAELRRDDLLSPQRSARPAWQRHIAILLVRQSLPLLSLNQIGMAFNRDHTTVLHALKRAHWHLAQDDAMAQLYRRSRAEIEAHWPEAMK